MADFLAPVGGQAVHEQRLRVGPVHQRRVHLILGEALDAVGLLVFLAHGGPHVGDHQVGAFDRLGGVALQGDPVRERVHQVRRRLEALRAAHHQLEIELLGGVDVAGAHVVAVAHPGHRFTGDAAPVLDVGLHVGEQLAGVELVGEGVDHRHPRVGGEGLHGVVVEGADHHRVHHPRQHPGGIFHRFAAPQLGVARRQEHAGAAELGHRHFERYPGAGGGLLENHAQSLAAQGFMELPGVQHGFQLHGALYQIPQLLGRQVHQSEKVARAAHGFS